ncbi:hypothetical protein MPSEU_000059800 [Mayamaea pseudoterrestris]|nr:hypothetical protein MPSEU_000059800 [Mayamaea pseudoterrestris]
MSFAAAGSAFNNADDSKQQQLYLHTPLIYSQPLSQLAARPVYCKLDMIQPSGSFKDRGMARLCTHLQTQSIQQLVSSSGGNAGLAVATVANVLQMQVHVIVPQTTKNMVIHKLQSLGALVTVHGIHWNEADLEARRLVAEANEGNDSAAAAYVSPYDHALLWTGHSSVVDELVEDLHDVPPAAILLSVGGGGLLCGVLEGLERHRLATTVVACETMGANSFAQALERGKPVRLDAINTVATSLGALEVTPAALERSAHYQQQVGGAVQSAVCTDAEAIDACLRFAKDHRLLVEPACGAALAVVYSKRLRTKLMDSLENKQGPIVIEVCGGSGVNIDLLNEWRKEYCDVME